MKKVLLCLIAVTILFLTACSSEPGGTLSTQDGIYEEEIASIYCDSLAKYNHFVTEGYKTQGYPGCTELPENFVTWEQASVFGEVKFLQLSLDYSHGHYSIRDENGEDFILYLDFLDGNGHKYDGTPSQKVVTVNTTRALGSMRKISASDNPMRILRDEFEYYYYQNGGLLRITWHYNGVEFKLAGGLTSYTVTKAPTIVSYLLAVSDETAETAFTQIRQTFSK